MTRKDFQMVAAIIAKMPDHAVTLRTQKISTARQFADGLATTNAAFDRARFLAACNLPQEG